MLCKAVIQYPLRASPLAHPTIWGLGSDCAVTIHPVAARESLMVGLRNVEIV
jgi:hypothetical protein